MSTGDLMSEGEREAMRDAGRGHLLGEGGGPRLKTCSVCKVAKPIEDFHKNRSMTDGHTYQCGECRCRIHQEKYEPHPSPPVDPPSAEETKSYMAAYHKAHKKEARARALFYNYGITVEQYDDLLAAQDGKCAICHRTEGDAKRERLFVDHDHRTGKVRGLLCGKCNISLGGFNDDTDLLRKAIQFLEADRD